MRLDAPGLHFGDPLDHALTIREKPFGTLGELWQGLPDHILIEHLHGEQRNEPDQCPQLERRGPSVNQKLVVVEPVLFIPQASATQIVE